MSDSLNAIAASVPFAGALHDFTRPMAERAKSRKSCGPYHWSPTPAGSGRGFYMQHGTRALRCADHGAGFRLRVIEGDNSFGLDQFGGAYTPIVLRLPRGRGFLIGATMGAGMCAHIEPGIWTDEDDAMRAAEDEARRCADREAEFRVNEDEDDDSEDCA